MMAVIAVGILIFCDHREQKFSTLMVERGVLADYLLLETF